MRFSGFAVCAALFLVTPGTFVQPAQAQTAQDRFEVAFQARETQRRATIASAMRFTEAEAEPFWLIYDQYRLVAKSHQLRRMRMIHELSESTIGMDAATGSSLVARALALESEQQSAKQTYMSDLAPIFSGARYFRLYQFETKLDAIFRHGWTSQIPLAVTEEERNILEESFDVQQQDSGEPTI